MQIMFIAESVSIGYLRTDRLRALAVTGRTRSESLPNVPILSDFLAGFEASAWQGVGAPRNTPAEVIERLNREINAALVDQKIKERLGDLSAVPMAMMPAEFGRFIGTESDKWGKVIRAAGIKAG
jgi:tripartite-type tricarboxylate transporter receptor subunit TctC